MSITNNVGKIAGYVPSSANVVIKLGDGAADIDVSAQSLFLQAGDGDHDVDAFVTQDLAVSLGDGFADIDAVAGGSAAISLGSGFADIDVSVGKDLGITKTDGFADIDAVAGGSASLSLGDGFSDIDIAVGQDLAISKGDGTSYIDAVAGGTAMMSIGDGFADISAVAGQDLAIAKGDGLAIIDATAGNNAQVKTGDGVAFIDVAAGASAAVTTGDGFAKIDAVAGDDIFIDTGKGNTDITATAGDYLQIVTGETGADKIKATAGGNAKIFTTAGDDNIDLTVGGNFTVVAGDDATNDNDTVKVRANLDNKTDDNTFTNYVSLGKGNDTAEIVANDTLIDKGTGDMTLAFFGDNVRTQSAASNNDIDFWGDDATIVITGKGKQDIKTLDFSIANGEYTQFADLLDQEKVSMGSSIDTVITESLTSTTNLDDVAKAYKLNDEQTEQLKSLDLNKTTSNGQPYYLLYQEDGQYQIGYRDDAGNTYDMNGNKLNYYNNSTSSSSKTTSRSYREGSIYSWNRWNTDYTTTTTTTTTGSSQQLTGVEDISIEQQGKRTTETVQTDYMGLTGVKNFSALFTEDGDYSVDATVSSGYAQVIGQNRLSEDGEQHINIQNGYITDIETTVLDSKVEDFVKKLNLAAGDLTEKSWNYTTSSSTTTTSYGTWKWDPLVLDTNKDGAVSALTDGSIEDNKGVDLGGAYAAATNGDKMVAMSDMNGNGKVDGSEVLGNDTINPFTKEALFTEEEKAAGKANGFEALKRIAQAAEAKGYTCIENGYVNMEKLSEALEKEANVKIGLISDENVTDLESMDDVKFISLSYVDNNVSTGKIQHNQKGSYIDANGDIYQADDIWVNA